MIKGEGREVGEHIKDTIVNKHRTRSLTKKRKKIWAEVDLPGKLKPFSWHQLGLLRALWYIRLHLYETFAPANFDVDIYVRYPTF